MLERAQVNELVLLIGLILVIAVIDIIMTGALPKWAILAPIFIPLFMRLGVAPQTVLAAYRIGDSPLNVVTPLMVYLPFVVLIAQKYVKSAGLGTIIALMIPYTIVVLVAWIDPVRDLVRAGHPTGAGVSGPDAVMPEGEQVRATSPSPVSHATDCPQGEGVVA